MIMRYDEMRFCLLVVEFISDTNLSVIQFGIFDDMVRWTIYLMIFLWWILMFWIDQII